MKPRSPHLTVVAVVAAFALGSAGTAVAGPALSKGAVKKIATKVVKKAAPKLSVASAATAGNAGNADRLDGLDSSDLTTSVHRFTLPAQTSSTTYSFSLPGLPNGTYLVTYDIVAGSGSAAAVCDVLPSLAAPSNTVAEGHATAVSGSSVSISGSAVFTSGGQSAFQCSSTFPFLITGGEVDLTRVDTVTTTVAGSLP